MHLNYGNDFTILRVVGGFICSLIAYRLYGVVSSYQSGAMFDLTAGSIISLLVSAIILIYCFTAYWKVDLKSNGIVSSYGCWFWHKQKSFSDVVNIQFKLDFIEVKNGPDKAYISVNVKPESRDRPYPVCSLYQLRESIVLPSFYKDKHAKEIRQFKADVDELISLYPTTPIEIDEKVPAFYKSISSEDFRWNANKGIKT